MANTADGHLTLRRLATSLDLSIEELGRMLGTSGDSVQRWERGLASVPGGQLRMLTRADDALNRLSPFSVRSGCRMSSADPLSYSMASLR